MDGYSVKIDKEDCEGPSPAHYAFNGRIMLTSLVILLVALIIIAFFHVYTRLHSHRIRRPRDELALNADASSAATPVPQGLGPTILNSLPTFVYSSKTRSSSKTLQDCAVCLSEFEDHETGRILPKCNHCFHVDCIDRWFQSHSNCPLCRAPVRNPDGTVVLVLKHEPQTDAVSGVLCPLPCPTNYQGVEYQMGCSNSSVQIVVSSLVEDSRPPEFNTLSLEGPDKSGDQGALSPFTSGSNGSPQCR